MAESTLPALTVREVARLLAVDEKTIYRLTQQGKLPGFKVAGAWRFQLRDIQDWIDQEKRNRGVSVTTSMTEVNEWGAP